MDRDDPEGMRAIKGERAKKKGEGRNKEKVCP